MTQKQSKNKKAKKAVKAGRSTPALKKKNPPSKNKSSKSKTVATSAKKVVKPSSKAVKKKLIVKKAVKPVKKTVSKKSTSKPVKKAAVKKTAKPAVAKKIIAKKVVKPEKKTEKKVLKPAKSVNKVIPTKPVKAQKPVKPGKEAKSSKKEKLRFDDEMDAGFDDEPVKKVKKSKGGRKRKNKNDDDDEPIIENDLLVEQLIQSTKRLKKPPKVPKQLRTFTNPMASLTVAKLVSSDKKGKSAPKKEPKGKFELEYVMHTSAGILYEFLTSPSGLAEWFADDVNIHDGIFTFFWEGSEQKAKLLGFKEDKFVRLQWLDKPEGSFFEFRIDRDELTGDISLIITDFADEAADMQTSKLLWDSQINKLLHVIGSY